MGACVGNSSVEYFTIHTSALGPSATVNNSVPGFKLTDESTTIAICGDEATTTTTDSPVLEEEEEEEDEEEEEEKEEEEEDEEEEEEKEEAGVL